MPSRSTPQPIPPLYPEVSYGFGGPLPSHVMFFGSGRQALKFLALRLLETDASLLFVLPAFTCETVIQAISEAGGEITFVDVADDLDWDLEDWQRVQDAHPDRRFVLVPTSLFGAPLRDYKTLFPQAWVVEDRCQATEDTASRADFQILSFGRGKLVSAMGGGALLGDVSAFAAAHAALPLHCRPFTAMLASLVMEQLVLRRGWRWLHRWMDKGADAPQPSGLSTQVIRVKALCIRHAQWIFHSIQHAKLASRVRWADRYAREIPAVHRFAISSGLPYLRYPVKGRHRLPGASSGEMYRLTWRMAEENRGRAMPGAARLVQCTMLPTHALVTTDHAQHCADVLKSAPPPMA